MNLEHLLNNQKQINSAIIRRKSFQCSLEYHQILEESSALNIFQNITISDRINFLLNRSKINFCPKCLKPYFKCNQKTYQLCNHKKKKDIIHVKYSKNRNSSLKVFIENKEYLKK